MLPTFEEVNDKAYGFTRGDLDLLLWETAQMTPLSADDLRMHLKVQLTRYHKRFAETVTGHRKGERDRIGLLVSEITRGWERYRIHAPEVGVRGVAPLQDWVENLLGHEGVERIEPK
ncbi:hypothetical protein HHL26_06780 [Sphingobium sp. TB-6]|uniref:hypothetical protein n=1 Tax=Sphingobium sp. TB-6 TaxID=2728850 RepID=UPI00146BC2F2|nr:hypothetical protein [Sphingobium sp. TB-6]NML88771.1 hypothetical protein [Sphingobium sp. TB-6]